MFCAGRHQPLCPFKGQKRAWHQVEMCFWIFYVELAIIIKALGLNTIFSIPKTFCEPACCPWDNATLMKCALNAVIGPLPFAYYFLAHFLAVLRCFLYTKADLPCIPPNVSLLPCTFLSCDLCVVQRISNN